MRQDAATIAGMLADRIGSLAPELFPAGRRDGHEWRVGSLAGERGQSLAIRLTGDRRGVWADFSSGERGDALDLVAATLFQGNRREALAWSRRWLGVTEDPGIEPEIRRPTLSPRRIDGELDRDAQSRRAAARKLWSEAAPGIGGTPVEAYLAGRGIELRDLGRAPGALRYHPAIWCGDVRRPLPAMLGAICGPTGKLSAIHRTWLAQGPDGTWVKASVETPKKVLGGFAGGSIRLWRGASGKALALAPEGEAAVIAEGIETGLSVAIACPERRVLCAVSLSNMGRIQVPDAIREIIIAADNDTGNESARQALDAACRQFIAQGRTVRIAMPENRGRDWNDVIRGKDGREAISATAQESA